MFGNKKVKELEKEYGKLIDQYDGLLEVSACKTCDKYYDGNVDSHIDRFQNCFDCTEDCDDLRYLARRLDDVLTKIDNL